MDENQNGENKRQPVAKGQITKGRRSIFKTLFDEIIVKNYEDMKSNFVEDVILPTTLDWLYGVASSFINDMFKTPGGRSSGSTLPSSLRTKKSYNEYWRGSSSRRDRDRRRERDEDPRDEVISYEDISFATKGEAEKVISSMRATLIDYEESVVTIADLCYFSDVPSTWADNKYGWTNLDDARSWRARDGRYYLDLPKPMPIDND